MSRLHTEPPRHLRISASVAFGTSPRARPAGIPVGASRAEDRMAITDRFVDLAEEATTPPYASRRRPVRTRGTQSSRSTAQNLRYASIFRAPRDSAWGRMTEATQLPHVTRISTRRIRGACTPRKATLARAVRQPDATRRSGAVGGGAGRTRRALLPTFIIGRLAAGRLQSVLSNYVPARRHIYASTAQPPSSRKCGPSSTFGGDRSGPERTGTKLEQTRARYVLLTRSRSRDASSRSPSRRALALPSGMRSPTTGPRETSFRKIPPGFPGRDCGQRQAVGFGDIGTPAVPFNTKSPRPVLLSRQARAGDRRELRSGIWADREDFTRSPVA